MSLNVNNAPQQRKRSSSNAAWCNTGKIQTVVHWRVPFLAHTRFTNNGSCEFGDRFHSNLQHCSGRDTKPLAGLMIVDGP